MVMKTGDWAAARAAVAQMGARSVAAVRAANKAEALLFRSLVVRAFNSQGKSNGKAWPKLAEATKKAKGSSKALIDTGDLRKSITTVFQGDEAFVGVTSKTRSRKGGPMVNIAAVHEFGKKVVQKRGTKMVIITIPERSFLRSTADFHFKPMSTKERFLARVAIHMGRGWATQAPAKAVAMAKAGLEAAKSSPKPQAPASKTRGTGGESA